jgi:hypothetical protein
VGVFCVTGSAGGAGVPQSYWAGLQSQLVVVPVTPTSVHIADDQIEVPHVYILVATCRVIQQTVPPAQHSTCYNISTELS